MKLILTYMVVFIVGVTTGAFIAKTLATNEQPIVVECEPVVLVIESENDVTTDVPKEMFLGKCKITAYCKENYPHVCNNGDSSVTATGTTPTANRTVAVDPSVIPYGSKVIINGHTYIAEDCGGAVKGNRVDILFDTHQEALNFGVQYANVSYIPKGGK